MVLKLFFYLDGPLLKPKWTSKLSKVKKLNKLGVIKHQIGKNKHIPISVRISDDIKEYLILDSENEESKSFIDMNPELKYKVGFSKRHLPILKSQIQKCVRRQNIEIGVKTAVSMVLIEDSCENVIQFGLFELLRRMTIIMIEDSVLSDTYLFMTWCLAVLSKGHLLNGMCIIKILELVKGVISSGFRDIKGQENMIVKIDEVDMVDMFKKSLKFSTITSVLFRHGFGGMDGEKKMLLNCASNWLYRKFYDSPTMKYTKVNQFIPLKGIKQLTKSEILDESLDHHCTDIVQRIKNYIEIDKETLEMFLWNNLSSVNNRIDIESNKIHDNTIPKINGKTWFNIKILHKMEICKMRYDL
jgi:hypothetical protein